MPDPDRGASDASWLRRTGGLAAGAALIALAVVAASWPVFSRPGSAVYAGGAVADTPWMRLLGGDPGAPVAGSSPDADFWSRFGAADTLRGVWTLAWWSHAALQPAASFFEGNTLFPVPRALTYADLQLGVVPWFAPTYWLTGNPVLAYQLALLLSATAGGVGFLVLVHRWTGSPAAALVAGIAAAIAPFRMHQLNLLYLFAIQYLPAGMLAIDAVFAGRRRALAAAGLAVAVILQASCSAYATYTAFLLLPAYAAGVLLEQRPPATGRAAAWLGAAFAVAASAIVWLYRPFFGHVATGVVPASGEAAVRHAGPLRLLWLFRGMNFDVHFVTGVGVPLLVLAACGLLHRTSRRRWTALGVTAVGAVLALGPEFSIGSVWVRPLPWAWLAAVVPGFGAQRHPVVTTTMVGVGVVCLAGLGVAALLERGRRHRAWAALAVLLVAWAAWTTRAPIGRAAVLPVATGDRVPPVYRWLANHGAGQPLLELPAQLVPNAVYAYFSTYHWLPTFNGTFSAPPPGYLALLDRAADALDPARGPAFLRDVPVTWVVVHKGLLLPAHAARLATPPPHLEQVARFGDDVVYRVRRP